METYKERISWNVQLFRKFFNMSQQQLAEKAKLNICTIFNLEHCKYKDVYVSTLESIAKVFSVDVEVLFAKNLSYDLIREKTNGNNKQQKRQAH